MLPQSTTFVRMSTTPEGQTTLLQYTAGRAAALLSAVIAALTALQEVASGHKHTCLDSTPFLTLYHIASDCWMQPLHAC